MHIACCGVNVLYFELGAHSISEKEKKKIHKAFAPTNVWFSLYFIWRENSKAVHHRDAPECYCLHIEFIYTKVSTLKNENIIKNIIFNFCN